MENSQTKIPHKLDSQAKHCSRLTGRLYPKETLPSDSWQRPLSCFLCSLTCVRFLFCCGNTNRALGKKRWEKHLLALDWLWLELGETSQEVTWQDVRYCCINCAISHHFSEIQARLDAGCYMSTAKVVTEVGTFSPSSEKPRASTLLHIPGNHPARGAA